MAEIKLVTLGLYPVVPPEEKRCPRCGSTRVHGHGWRKRRVRDWQHTEVEVRRLRCAICGATWTVYPEGVQPGSRFSLRAEQAMVLLYVLGLSYRKAAMWMRALGVRVAHTTILNFVQAYGSMEEIRRKRRYWQGKARVKRVGMDGTGVKMAGKPDDTGVVVVVDAESGTGLWIEAVDEKDQEALKGLVQWVLERFRPEEVVTDEASAYPLALEAASAKAKVYPAHRLCAAHFRRNKIGRLRQLMREAEKRKWGFVVMEMRALEEMMRGSPPEVWGGFAWKLLRFMQMARPPGKGKRASWAYKWRMLLLEIGQKASRVTGITNNRTEQFIGRAFKIRVSSMRGFKRDDNRMRFLHLALAIDEKAQREGVIYVQ